MEAVELLQQQLEIVRGMADSVIESVDESTIHWSPPGTANPIVLTLLHAALSEDKLVQKVVRGGRTVFEAREWGPRLGLPALPLYGASWTEIEARKVACEIVLAYQREVRAATDEYLNSLSSTELTRLVQLGESERTVAEVLSEVVIHEASHAGEIAALKGVRGLRGLPY